MPLFNIKKEVPKTFEIKPEATKTDIKPAQQESGNVYTNIFEKPLKPEETLKSDIISGVYAKEKNTSLSKENILGPLPELQSKIIGAFDPSKRNLKMARTAFISLVVLSLLIIGFFYAELNPKFDLLSGVRGPNTAQKLSNTRNDVLAQQTTINQKNYLLLNYYLQQLSYLSDTYSKARNEQPPPETLVDLQNQIILTYENAQAKRKEPMTVSTIPPEMFETELKKNLQVELNKLTKEEQSPDIKSQVNDYGATLKLVGNKTLGSLLNKNTDDLKADLPRDDTKLYALTSQILDTLKNDFNVISELKKKRLPWADIVNEIEKITKSVDTLYNTGFFEELGGIQYSSYDFDANTKRVIISGRVKRDDGTTFSLIANLIDTLEKSSLFMNVDNRSYPKSGTEEEGYSSSFRIEFSLENASEITLPKL